jgi:hypothetical protein
MPGLILPMLAGQCRHGIAWHAGGNRGFMEMAAEMILAWSNTPARIVVETLAVSWDL